MVRPHILVQAEAFDIAAEFARTEQCAPDAGAVVSFTGKVRSEGGTLAALTLEHYPGMTENEISRVAQEAAERWSLKALTVIHRFGTLVPGDDIVLVVTASDHRKDAFEAANFLMDHLKTRAPFWKEEELNDGRKAWVDAKSVDDEAAERWRKGD